MARLSGMRASPLLVALLACAALLSLLHLPLSVRSAAPPAQVVVGVVMPFTGTDSRQGLRAKAVLEMFAQDLNEGRSIGGWPANFLGAPLTLAFKDSASNVMTAQRALHELRAQHGSALMAVIGEISDEVTMTLDFLASSMGLLFASPAATTPSLGSLSEHPYFLRTSISAEAQAQFWLRLARKVGWYRLALIASSDDRGNGITDVFSREVVKYNKYATEFNNNRTSLEEEPMTLHDFHNYDIPAAPSTLATAVTGQALDQLHASGIRVFFLQAGVRNEEVLRMAYERGMIGLGSDGIIRQWAGDYCTQDLASALEDLPGALFGSICTSLIVPRTRPDMPTTPSALAFEARLRALDATLWPATRYVSNFDISVASALFAIVGLMGKTFADPALPNTAASFISHLTKRDGSDPFEFLEADLMPLRIEWNGNPVITQLDLLSYNVDAHRFLVSGTFDYNTMAFTPSPNPLTMATGSVAYTKDRAHVYVTDDPLPQTFDGKIVVLAFVVIVLGAWTALILLEQALSFWSRGIWKQAMGWVALASLAFGSAAVWPNTIMVFTALTLDVDAKPALQEWSIGVSAVFPAVLTLLSFFLSIWSVDGGLKPAANVNVDEISAVTGQSSTTGGSASGSGKSSSHTTTSKSHLRILRTAITKQLDKFREFFVETMRRAGPKLALASLLLAVCFVTHFLIVMEGFHMRAQLHLDAGAIIGALFLSWVLNFVSLAMYFHVTRSGARYLAPFLLCASLIANLLVIMQGSHWTYVETDITTSGMENARAVKADYTLAVIVASVSAALCVALMAFNVNRLRLSRNVLDKVLSQVAGQVRALENDIEYEKEVRQALREQSDFFRRSLELINLCRPLWRPYAVAIALADPDDAAAVAAAEKLGVTGPQALEKARLAPAGTKKAKQATEAGGGGGGSSVHDAAVGGSKDKAGEGSHKGSKSKGDKPAPGATSKVLGGAGAAENSAHGPHSASGVESVPRPQLPGTMMATEQPTRKVMIASPTGASAAASAASAAASPSGGSAGPKTVVVAGTSSSTPSDFKVVHAPKREKQLMSLLKELNELHLEGPPPGRAVADIKLPQILSNPVTIELMKDVLAKNLSPENIALWIDIQRYRSLENAQVRKAVADEICQTFIVSGAKFEVNLSSFMRDYVMTQVVRGASALDLFDEVEREIYRLMVTNNLEPLVQSNMFKLAALVVGHPALKLRSVSLANNVRGEIGGNVPSAIGGGGAQQQTTMATGAGTGNSQGMPQGSQGMRGPSVGMSTGTGGGGAATGAQNNAHPAFAARIASNSQRGSGITATRGPGGVPAGLPASPKAPPTGTAASSASSTPRQPSFVAPEKAGASHVELAWPTK